MKASVTLRNLMESEKRRRGESSPGHPDVWREELNVEDGYEVDALISLCCQQGARGKDASVQVVLPRQTPEPLWGPLLLLSSVSTREGIIPPSLRSLQGEECGTHQVSQ